MSGTNPLVSNAKAAESSLHAALHPLVLLTISDYITRHTLRGLTTPIVGGIIGQQNGREITIEHAYDVKLEDPNKSGGKWLLLEDWFEERLQQYKEVHKDPVLDLVGWWTISPVSGPSHEMAEIHKQVMKFNESALLLTFHPEAIIQGSATGGKLPLTIYETVYENFKGEDDMQVEGEEGGNELELKLKEMRYEIATGEAEMISVDFVARGGGNATAVEGTMNPHAKPATDPKGKSKETEKPAESFNLNPEEEEMVSFLTSRANAIKMLHARIGLIRKYLQGLPSSFVADPDAGGTPPSHPELRAILALAVKLPLVVPLDRESYNKERTAERSDVTLVQLLNEIGRSVQDAQQLGAKHAYAESNKKTDRSHLMSQFTDMDPTFLGESFDGVTDDV